MRSRRLLEPPAPPPERSFWQLLPRRNFRRAFLLVIAILGVLAIKHTGGISLNRVFDRVAPPPQGSFQHIEVKPAPRDMKQP